MSSSVPLTMACFAATCVTCGSMFPDNATLQKHHNEAHPQEKMFPCSQCEKGFKELRTLRLHMKIHNAEYPERCGVCHKVFRTKWQLKQHQMDHGGQRPYPCPECSFTCKTKQQLNEHRRKHSGEKAYSCSQCSTRFTYRNGLIKHTKLNRCPKKIVTPGGETIVKKRSRIAPTYCSSDHKVSSSFDLVEDVAKHATVNTLPSFLLSLGPSGQATNQVVVDSPIAAVDPAEYSPPNLGSSSSGVQGIGNEGALRIKEELDTGGDFAPGQHRGDQAGGRNGAFFASRIPAPSSENGDTGGSRAMWEATVNELKAVTGLSTGEICLWASTLPPGSTVKVTTTTAAHASTCGRRRSGNVFPLPPASYPDLHRRRLQAHVEVVVKGDDEAGEDLKSGNLVHPQVGAFNQDVVISTSLGLPSYQESFAVDPRKVLRQDLNRDAVDPTSATNYDDLNFDAKVKVEHHHPCDAPPDPASDHFLAHVKEEPVFSGWGDEGPGTCKSGDDGDACFRTTADFSGPADRREPFINEANQRLLHPRYSLRGSPPTSSARLVATMPSRSPMSAALKRGPSDEFAAMSPSSCLYSDNSSSSSSSSSCGGSSAEVVSSTEDSTEGLIRPYHGYSRPNVNLFFPPASHQQLMGASATVSGAGGALYGPRISAIASGAGANPLASPAVHFPPPPPLTAFTGPHCPFPTLASIGTTTSAAFSAASSSLPPLMTLAAGPGGGHNHHHHTSVLDSMPVAQCPEAPHSHPNPSLAPDCWLPTEDPGGEYSSTFNLNDHDFVSIRSLVEQAFKDGTDYMDIMSAV